MPVDLIEMIDSSMLLNFLKFFQAKRNVQLKVGQRFSTPLGAWGPYGEVGTSNDT